MVWHRITIPPSLSPRSHAGSHRETQRGLAAKHYRIGGFHCAATGVSYRSNVGAERSTTVCVQLVGVCPWWSSGSLFGLQWVVSLVVAQRWGRRRGASVTTRLPEAGPAYTWRLSRTPRISPQTNTCLFCALCPHSCAPGKDFSVGHPLLQAKHA
jgi:hypothetical protein